MSNKPRSEVFFPVVQTPVDTNYVPLPSRDPAMIALFEGRPKGIRIAWQQMIGTEATARAFDAVVARGSEKDIREVADFFATLAIGTAHHAFSQSKGETVMYHRVKLPAMVEPDFSAYTTQSDLIEAASSGLNYATELAGSIEAGVQNQKPVNRLNDRFGRSLAQTGLTLAVISGNVADLRDDEYGMQHAAWEAGQSAYTRTIELSGYIGARPTLAQLADKQSPLRRYMHDDPRSISNTLYQVVNREVEAITP